MLIKESDLEPYYSPDGHLSVQAIDRFFADKGVLKLFKREVGYERILVMDKNNKTEYFDASKQIEDILRNKQYKKQYKEVGNMGVKLPDNITPSEKIDPDSIKF